MANATVRGTAECIAAFQNLKFTVRARYLRKAVLAGAEIAKSAIEVAAPVGIYKDGREKMKGKQAKYGPIKSNIILYQRKRTFTETGDYISILAGPSKKAFYSYFQEKGSTATRWRGVIARAISNKKAEIQNKVVEVLSQAVRKRNGG